MTAAKHTPGPWQIGPGSSLNAFTIHADEAGVLIGYTFPRVKVSKGKPVSQEPTDEDWANARLIVAAPEMFEELNRIHVGTTITTEHFNRIRRLLDTVQMEAA